MKKKKQAPVKSEKNYALRNLHICISAHQHINFVYPFCIFLFLFFIYSCQRELSFDKGIISVGSLTKDAAGNCHLITVEGNFIAGQNLGDSNYLEADVMVTIPGSYQLRTDTVNGFYFHSSGNFTTTGSVRVQLQATGRPIAPGTYNFTIWYDTSRCQVSVTIRSNLQSPASFTLEGTPDKCMNARVSGNYLKNIPLDTSNKVNISLTVTNPGTYSISTNTVNGYRFSGSGVLSGTTNQVVTLTASGSPLNAGTNTFTVDGGTTTCTFQVTVLDAVTSTNNDYFPLTNNSYWTYILSVFPYDSVRRMVLDTVTKNGSLYKLIDEPIPFVANRELFFRKAGINYYEYAPVDKYTKSFSYSPQLFGDILFLKENLNKGDTWQSPEFSGTATFGQVIILQYQFSCEEINAVVTVNGFVFANVYKFKVKPRIRSVGNPFGDTFEEFDFYYAKGIGMIHTKKTMNGFDQYEYNIRRWLVN